MVSLSYPLTSSYPDFTWRDNNLKPGEELEELTRRTAESLTVTFL
jgi:hypothetical protein